MNVLVLNAGSSSLKYQVISGEERLRRGVIDRVGDIDATIAQVLRTLKIDVHAIGHRVVHGGELFSESAIISDRVLDAIQGCAELAPLHNTVSIEGIVACRALFGADLPQVAVFDTAFHHSIPERAFLYAVPYDWYRKIGYAATDSMEHRIATYWSDIARLQGWASKAPTSSPFTLETAARRQRLRMVSRSIRLWA